MKKIFVITIALLLMVLAGCKKDDPVVETPQSPSIPVTTQMNIDYSLFSDACYFSAPFYYIIQEGYLTHGEFINVINTREDFFQLIETNQTLYPEIFERFTRIDFE